MAELLEALLTYANENRILHSPEAKAQMRQSSLAMEKAHEELLSLLSGKERQCFEDYCCEMDLMQRLELEALFRAGLSIGQELSRI